MRRAIVPSLVGAALFTVGGVVAYASIPDSSGVIHGCYSKTGGFLRVVDSPTATCTSRETPLNWNQAWGAGRVNSAQSSKLDTVTIAGGTEVALHTVTITTSGGTLLIWTQVRGGHYYRVTVDGTTAFTPLHENSQWSWPTAAGTHTVSFLFSAPAGYTTDSCSDSSLIVEEGSSGS
jgi:hypothetical protein